MRTELMRLATAAGVFACSAVAAAQTGGAWGSHIRVTDSLVVQALDEGVAGSATLRSYQARLEKSDVIVYVRPDPDPLSQGGVTFLSAAGGARILSIRLPVRLGRPQMVAELGRNLRLAVALADDPSISDAEAFKKAVTPLATSEIKTLVLRELDESRAAVSRK